jgi:hypothetical protein
MVSRGRQLLASARHRLVVMPGLAPGIHERHSAEMRKAWMGGSSPAMTIKRKQFLISNK